MKEFFAKRPGMILTGVLIGLGAALLAWFGNPKNMGLCMACFERDLAGALGMHRADAVQYLRPEIPALLLGAFCAALIAGEWKPRGGSSTMVRFAMGLLAAFGALVFLGCPWRGLLRLAGGDLNAIVGLGGLAIGIGVGALFIRGGFSLGRNHPARSASGFVAPILALALLGLLLFNVIAPGGALFSSVKGPGAMRAPVLISIAVAFAVGILAQRSRFCTVGAFRNFFLTRDTVLLTGLAVLVLVAFAFNLATGAFRLGFSGQPISHANHLWNALGMMLAGLAYTLGAGCPGRQLVLAGEGDHDASVFVIGMIGGAALAHNFAAVAKPDALVDGAWVTGGPGGFGMAAVLFGLALCLAIGFGLREKRPG
jgi:hypothetical protein